MFEASSNIASSPESQKQSVSDLSDKQTSSIAPKQPTNSHPIPQLTYSQVAIAERRSLLKTWMATVIGTAIACALVSGIKDIRALVTTSMSAGSIAFVVSALGNSSGNK
jgi:hypothetical protein